MPELPEISNLAAQVNTHLSGKIISGIQVIQPKTLNLPVEEFTAALLGARIEKACYRGKWVVIETTQGWLLLNLGMGGEALLTTRQTLPEKHRLIIDFSDETCLSINFWWFGYVHYAPPGALERHEMVGKLGPNALDLSDEMLGELLRGRRGNIKTFLLDQTRIAGIGNSYIHDILFIAGLHPLRKIDSLSGEEVTRLAQAIQQRLRLSIEKGGAFYEMDLFGKKGNFQVDDIVVGYREGQPCPRCGTLITKIKTGSTSSFLCPSCQPLE